MQCIALALEVLAFSLAVPKLLLRVLLVGVAVSLGCAPPAAALQEPYPQQGPAAATSPTESVPRSSFDASEREASAVEESPAPWPPASVQQAANIMAGSHPLDSERPAARPAEWAAAASMSAGVRGAVYELHDESGCGSRVFDRRPSAGTVRTAAGASPRSCGWEDLRRRDGGCRPYVRGQRSLLEDLEDWPRDLYLDAVACVSWNNALQLAIPLGGSLAIRGLWDDDVRDWTERSPRRWGNVSGGLSEAAMGHWQLAGIAGLYGASLGLDDPFLHDMSGGLLNAWLLTSAATWAIKGPADTRRPDGGRYGYPSGHTSTSFTIAAVVDEYYGPWMGVPAYGLAGLVGWSRIDLRRHDLSDVVFGAALGYVIGKSVARRRLDREQRFELLPYVDLDGTRGLMLQYDLK